MALLMPKGVDAKGQEEASVNSQICGKCGLGELYTVRVETPASSRELRTCQKDPSQKDVWMLKDINYVTRCNRCNYPYKTEEYGTVEYIECNHNPVVIGIIL